MDERQVELSVGQVLQVGNVLLTILDVDGDEIHVQIDEQGEREGDWMPEQQDQWRAVLSLPR